MELKEIKKITDSYKHLGTIVYETHKDIRDLQSGLTRDNEPLEIACMRSISNNIGKYYQMKKFMRRQFIDTNGQKGGLQVMPKEIEQGMRLGPQEYLKNQKQLDFV